VGTATRQFPWPTLLAGVALGMLALQLAAVQPLAREVRQLHADMSTVQSSLGRLVAARDGVSRTNSLLADLLDQQRQLEMARTSLESVRELHQSVRQEAARSAEATAALGQLIAVNTRLIDTRTQRVEVAAALDAVGALQQQVALLGEAATAHSMRLDEADRVVGQLADLKQRVIGAASGIDNARACLADVNSLRQSLITSTGDAAAARVAADGLISLQETVVRSADDMDAATSTAERLVALQSTLVHDERLDLEQAGRNAAELLRLQDTLATQTERVGESIVSLELLVDFRDELIAQVAGMEPLRRQMSEFLLLDAAVSQALRTLSPLTELVNLRRLDSRDVQAAARTILDQRRTRLAGREPKYPTAAGESQSSDSVAEFAE
jgi:hypothetical protein